MKQSPDASITALRPAIPEIDNEGEFAVHSVHPSHPSFSERIVRMQEPHRDPRENSIRGHTPILVPAESSPIFDMHDDSSSPFTPVPADSDFARRAVNKPESPTVDARDRSPKSSFGDSEASWESASEFTLRDDLRQLVPTLWGDLGSVVRCESAVVLVAAAGASVALRENADGEVRAYTAHHPNRWGKASTSLGYLGEITYQVPVVFAVYGASLWAQDEKLHECSKALVSAFGITAASTVAIKRIADTQRPTNAVENGRYGFPSYHASSTFSIAAVVDEYYGWPVGLPSYALASLVAWSRIDERAHDLSDVVFGSALGFVIGKSIALSHIEQLGDARILPYYDPAIRGFGIVYQTEF